MWTLLSYGIAVGIQALKGQKQKPAAKP